MMLVLNGHNSVDHQQLASHGADRADCQLYLEHTSLTEMTSKTVCTSMLQCQLLTVAFCIAGSLC